ncbi:MAG: hypothetical protein WCD62_02480 [Pseudolabrys sp.]
MANDGHSNKGQHQERPDHCVSSPSSPGFTHIVAGSMEAYLLVLAGDWAWWQMLSQFLLLVLIGNMIGGTALFALLSYAQVMEEI